MRVRKNAGAGRGGFARPGFVRLGLVWLAACLGAGGFLAFQGFAALGGSAPCGSAPRAAGAPQQVRAETPGAPAYRTKGIEDVRAGERVWAWDPQASRWEVREVVRPLVHDYDGDVIAVRAGGEAVEATGNHPFWVVAGEGLGGRPAAADVPEAERRAVAAEHRGGGSRPGTWNRATCW